MGEMVDIPSTERTEIIQQFSNFKGEKNQVNCHLREQVKGQIDIFIQYNYF